MKKLIGLIKAFLFGNSIGFFVGFLVCYWLYGLDKTLEERKADRERYRSQGYVPRVTYSKPIRREPKS